MNKIIILVLAAAIGGIVTFFLTKENKPTVSIKEEANIIVEKIEKVNKLISLESNVSEVYTFDQSDDFFYGLVKIPKKAIVIAKAKVYISHDLSKMNYQLDEVTKTVILRDVPKPQIIIEPILEFYDLKTELLPFSEKELSQLNQRATAMLREEVKQSDLIKLAEKNLQLNLQEIILTAQSKGWKVEMEKNKF